MSKINDFIKDKLKSGGDEPILVFNVEDVIKKHQKWSELLPRVVPYYAVKANPYPFLLEIMLGLGAKFDCASQHEMQEVLKLGAKPNDIIIANPSKTEEFLELAKKQQVNLMTFDNKQELIKISSVFPEASLVLRIVTDGKYSSINFRSKFGAEMKDVETILKKAKRLNLNVIGVSFNVGSACQSGQAFVDALNNARIAFDLAKGMGFSMSLLDIGGGFPGSQKLYFQQIVENVSDFEAMTQDINKCLDDLFPEHNLTIIAEPGRYFCESAFTLVTKVISKRFIDIDQVKTAMYYLNDSVYNTFWEDLPDRKIFQPIPFLNTKKLTSRQVYNTILWGPTCSSRDRLQCDYQMKEVHVGERILFKDVGSYSVINNKLGFNGFPFPKIEIFLTEGAKSILVMSKL